MSADPQARALEAATAAAEVIPAAEPLTAAGVQEGNEHVAASFAAATLAELTGGGKVAILVGSDLVTALAQSPMGGLDVAAAVQPGFDAAAASLGSSAKPARQIELDAVVEVMGESFTAIPLLGEGIDAAVLISDDVLNTPAGVAVPEAGSAAGGAEPAAGASGEMPGAMPGQMPGQMPGAMPGQMPGGMPGQMPGMGVAPGAMGLPDLPDPSLAGLADPSLAVAAHMPQMPPAGAGLALAAHPMPVRGLDMLAGVDMELTVELGRTRMSVRDLLALTPGDVLELDRAAGSPADLLVNGRLIARGEVVVVEEDFGLRITEIVGSD